MDMTQKYVDAFVVPVRKSNIEAYKQVAEAAGRVWKEHGALDYVECIADDVKPGKVTSFPQAVKLEDDEVVVFSWIVYEFPRTTRPGQRRGDGRSPHQGHGPEVDALRRDAHVLGRVPGAAGRMNGSARGHRDRIGEREERR